MIQQTLFSGISLSSHTTKVYTDFSGINFESNYNLTFTIYDGLTLLPITADILLENLTAPTDIFTNGNSNISLQIHKFVLKDWYTIRFTVSKNNYQTFTAVSSWNPNYTSNYDIFLYPDINEPLACDSFITNETGLRLSKMILGQKNYITCNFTLSDFTSESDYFVAFTQSLLTGNKFNMKELQAVYMGLVGSNLHQWRAEIPSPQNGVYFTSSIRKKI